MLQRIYTLLCQLYGLERHFMIKDFLLQVAPPILVAGTTKISHRLPSREALFIQQHEQEVQLGLFFHPDILMRLQKNSSSIDDLACAIEGVSHFVYVAQCAEVARQCSRLELELQGEVDKFALLHLFAAEKQQLSLALFQEQFEHFEFAKQLSVEELERYETAHHFAAKYCHFLRERCFFPLRMNKLITYLRTFFHGNLQEKLLHVIP